MPHFDETEHPRGQAGNRGQFRDKVNTKPDEALLDAVQLPVFTPDDVRNVDFTLDVIRESFEGWEPVRNLRENGSDDEGNTILQWEHVVSYGGVPSSVFKERIRVSDDGEIIARESGNNDGYWGSSDFYGDDLTAMRMKVNRARLAMAGVYVTSQDSDGGYSGNKFVGGRVAQEPRERVYDAAVIARETRKHIKEAVRWGALPAEYTYSVNTSKFSMGQSIRIGVSGMPDSKHYVEREPGFAYGASAHSREVHEVLEMIGNQWNVDDSDSQTDYFDVTYYLHVDIDSEHMTRFRDEQRELARKKRLAKKGLVA